MYSSCATTTFDRIWSREAEVSCCHDFENEENDRRSKRNLCNCVKKPEKKNSGLQRGLNPWPRDTGAMLYQLSYEATDVGSRSIVGWNVPVKKMSVTVIWNIYICHDFVAKSAAIHLKFPQLFATCNSLICCNRFDSWVVKRETSLFNSFCRIVAKLWQVACFCCP